MSNFETLTVEDVVQRERTDRLDSEGNPETFPVVLIAGVSLSISSTGNQSFTKRRVSLPLNGFTIQEGKVMFPKGMKLEGFRIEQYEVDPYEWTTPDGEVRTDNVRYRLRDMSKPADPVAQEGPRSSAEPVQEPTDEVGTDSK